MHACDGPPNVDARNNWWGDASGPYHPTLNSGGLGDEVSNNVDFDPWLKGRACEPVGGIWIPVDKFALLTPWIGLASLVIISTVAVSVVYVRYRKKG